MKQQILIFILTAVLSACLKKSSHPLPPPLPPPPPLKPRAALPPAPVPYSQESKINKILKEHLAVNVQLLTLKDIQALTRKQIQSLSPQQLKSFKDQQLQAFSFKQIGFFTSEQIAVFLPRQIAAFTLKQIRALSKAQVQALTIQQLRFLPLTHLSNRQTQYLVRKQIISFTNRQITQMRYFQIQTLGPYFSDQQLHRLIQTHGELLAADFFRPSIIKKLNASEINIISGTVLAFNADQIASLQPHHIMALPGRLINQLPHIASLLPEVISALSAEHLSVLSEAFIHNLTGRHIQAFTPNQMLQLGVEVFKKFKLNQLWELQPEQAEGFSDAQWRALPAELQQILQFLRPVLVHLEQP